MSKEERTQQILVIDNKIVVNIPVEFKDYWEMIQTEEYQEFVSNKKKEEREKERIEEEKSNKILLDNGKIPFLFMGARGTSNSMFDYIEDFIKDWNNKKRKEKIEKILKCTNKGLE